MMPGGSCECRWGHKRPFFLTEGNFTINRKPELCKSEKSGAPPSLKCCCFTSSMSCSNALYHHLCPHASAGWLTQIKSKVTKDPEHHVHKERVVEFEKLLRRNNHVLFGIGEKIKYFMFLPFETSFNTLVIYTLCRMFHIWISGQTDRRMHFFVWTGSCGWRCEERGKEGVISITKRL